MKECKNCAFHFKGNFCPNCGQKDITKRFTTKESISWLFSSIFNLEKGFYLTTIELFKTPGKLVREYLDGVTIKYIHPFRYLFLWATISTLIAVYTDAYDQMSELGNSLNPESKTQAAFNKSYLIFLKQYMSFIILGMIPFFSLASSLIYKKQKLYFAEHLILNSYLNSLTIIVGIPILLLHLFLPTSLYLSLSSMVMSALVAGYMYSKFFKENYLLSVMKYVVIYILTVLFIMIIGIVVVIIHILLIKFAGFENIYVQ